MNATIKSVISVGVLVLGLVVTPLWAQDSSPLADRWAVTVAPYIWFASLDTTNTVDGLSGHSDLSFSDVFDLLQMSFNARAEARKGPWGVICDVTYLDLGEEVEGSRDTIDYELDGVIRNLLADFAVSYRIHERWFGHNVRQKIAIDPYAGLRFGYLKQELKLDVDIPDVGPQGARLGGSENWVEPFIGCRVLWTMSEKTTAGIRGDVGGFGIGSASDLTSNIVVWLSYQITDRIDLGLGYRILELDYSRGSGDSEFGLDVRADGPLLGACLRF